MEVSLLDMKVCDICGDAGREDLLAICSHCNDGAEHTYCMREMLTKVPEGEWLCEECQALELVGKRREEKIAIMGEIDSSEHLNNSDVDVQKSKGSTRIPSKRHRDDDDAEVSSIVKKPAHESNLGSPRPSSSVKTAVLTRENSIKSIDKGRVQSQDIAPVNDKTESGSCASDLRVHSFRGTFSKSNSFGSLNSKPKVKLVDQAVIQRQKSAKEASSFHHKESVVRSIGKSMSCKSRNSDRPESKVKMLSPRLSHIQDIRNTEHRSSFDRQHPFKAERSSMSSMMGNSVSSTSRSNKRPSSLATMANSREVKPVQADSKSATLSRSSSFATRKTTDLTSSSGDFKRPLTHGRCTVGGPSTNGGNSNENKVNRTNFKSDSIAVERSALNMEEEDEGDNLKASIEAAVLRKLGVYRKNRAVSQSDDSSAPTSGDEVTCREYPISCSTNNKKLSSDAELNERPTVSRNFTADSQKQETSHSVKQSSLVRVDGLSSAIQDGVHINYSRRDVLINVQAGMPFFFKTLAVPEHEYIWQGSFEIFQSSKTIDSWDGIQAHVSTCASQKVTDAVNNFKRRISLYEVPRSSTWPVHFQEHGVREDNIALYFFAKDLDCYDKIYKVLLDNMMKNDLALKGNVNGVELLIFPSSQLPDHSQRWNMLFFLWGVFRGKDSCLQLMPVSPNQFCTPQSIPPPIMSLPESRCSFIPIAEDQDGSGNAVTQVLETPASEELQRLLSSRVANRDYVHIDNANRCQDMAGTSQEKDTSSICSPCTLGVENCSSSQKQSDSPVDRHGPTKSVASISVECINEASISGNKLDKVRSPPKPTQAETVLIDRNLDKGHIKIEQQHERRILNHNECTFTTPVLPQTPGEAFRDAGDDVCGKANNHHDFILDQSAAAAERLLFSTTESRFAPDLELALWACERKSPIIEPFDLDSIDEQQQAYDEEMAASPKNKHTVNNNEGT
ncbi:RING/FYVE/PHD zinc finger superfamily protein [Striga hermonthica]|uniref:RING/FYVE/PHD zinc finger superfamily protein n=1 Tax=Striga hermonthica TaxID=68872 RepID=A0A9N7R8A5_STRHE|nr:RING/FYVE/PHD zinc finger superfamily protein [Striga hermonthica]